MGHPAEREGRGRQGEGREEREGGGEEGEGETLGKSEMWEDSTVI